MPHIATFSAHHPCYHKASDVGKKQCHKPFLWQAHDGILLSLAGWCGEAQCWGYGRFGNVMATGTLWRALEPRMMVWCDPLWPPTKPATWLHHPTKCHEQRCVQSAAAAKLLQGPAKCCELPGGDKGTARWPAQHRLFLQSWDRKEGIGNFSSLEKMCWNQLW